MDHLSRFELRRNRVTRQWRWVLRSSNHEVICTSETYKRKIDAVAGIDAVKRIAPHASIVEP